MAVQNSHITTATTYGKSQQNS